MKQNVALSLIHIVQAIERLDLRKFWLEHLGLSAQRYESSLLKIGKSAGMSSSIAQIFKCCSLVLDSEVRSCLAVLNST